jgi:hypothetical protein
MANRKRKTVEVEQSAHITSLQTHIARSSGKAFGKRRRAKLALWSRRKSLAFILGASLGLWAVVFGLIWLLHALV